MQLFVDALGSLFEPAELPSLQFDGDGACDDAAATPPASYCPATNTISVDIAELERYSKVSDGLTDGVVSGDNTAYSILTSRYMLALQHERGVPLDNADAALRTACLTGVATAKLFDGVTDSSGGTLTLTAGDLDEALSGMLTNGMAASDVNGQSVPSGFSRVDALRAGVLTADAQTCYDKFS